MISVCIATHNGERYIKEQVNSILTQLNEEDEIVVSDDGSTDHTIEILEAINDKRIHLYRFTQPCKSKTVHTYVCRNFENALLHAKGDYIYLSDQDDWWMPDKVEKIQVGLRNHILVVHRAEICDENLSPKGILMYGEEFVYKNFLALKAGKYYGCTIAFRNGLLKYILPFPIHLLLHDHWIGCVAELVGSVYYEKTPLIKYRQHGSNTSGGTSNNSWAFKVWYRIYMYVNLIKRTIIVRKNNF